MNPSGAHRHHHDSAREASSHRIPVPGFLANVVRYIPRNRPARIAAAAGVVIITLALLAGIVFRGSFPAGVAGPWITRAIEEKLGPGHRVEIGETWFETDSAGNSLLRVRDLVVRGPDNEIIASAPTAEVELEGGLFGGNFRARRIDLVNAELTVQIAADGHVSIVAGRDAKPTTPGPRPATARQTKGAVPLPPPSPTTTSDPFRFSELIAWLDGLDKRGLDGIALTEIGLKQGTLVVDSARSGRRWSFRNIDTRLERQPSGLSFTISSGTGPTRWTLTATIGVAIDGGRAIDIVADRIAPRDLLLAAGFDGIDFHAETPLSGILRAQIAGDGRLTAASLRLVTAAGEVGKTSEPESRFMVEEMQLQARFDPERRAVIIDPIAFVAGANRTVIQAVIEGPKGDDPSWPFSIVQGRMVLSTGQRTEPPLVIDRVFARGAYDPRAQRIIIQQGELTGATAGLAFSGSIGVGGQAPILSLGIAGTRMSASAFKRLWSPLVAPRTRAWVMHQVDGGIIDRALIALGIPLDKIGSPDTPLPDAAVRIEILASGVQFRPINNLPPVRDAAINMTLTGRTAKLRMERGIVDTPAGKRVTLRDGVLDILDHTPIEPNAMIKFRLEGAADAVAELVAMDPLRGVTGFTFDPATTKGSVVANVQLNFPMKRVVTEDDIDYLVDAEVKNFAAERTVREQRVDAVSAKLTLTQKTIMVKGDGQIAGAPATFEYKRTKGALDAEFRLASTFDDAARARFGLDFAPWLAGPVGVKAQGRVTDRETRIDVEADLTAARVADLVPGWQKAAGRPSKATYRVTERDTGVRIENLNVTGSGTTLRGSIEFDKEGGLVAATLPVFHLTDADKANLRAERTTDGVLKVVVRGDVLDARGITQSLTEGSPAAKAGRDIKPRDLDIDLRLAAATGHNGEVARQLELRVSRRNGEVKSFALLGRIGADASIVGELRVADGIRPVLYITAGDAGAFFRFANLYTRIQRGEVWVVIDSPKATIAPQEGVVAVRDFVIRGEPAIDRLLSAAPPPDQTERGSPQRRVAPTENATAFSRMRVHFTRTPGRFVIREGFIFGPVLGATVDGVLDYTSDQVQLRGTYIPAYGLNNIFGRIPVLGYILGGGPNEGLLAVTFEIAGPASRPLLRVNPMSAVAPGIFRKIFEYRSSPDLPPPDPLPR